MFIVNPGIYRAQADVRRGPNDSSGLSHSAVGLVLAEQTTDIPGALGVRFGFYFVVVGQPVGATVPMRIVIRFPEPGLIEPGKAPAKQVGISFDGTINDADYREWLFEDFWEIVPGIWTFEFWHGDRKLREQRFRVILPGSS